MEKNEIISRVEEFLHNKYDAGGIDCELVEDCVDSTLEAINYTHSCKSDSEQLVCNYCLEETNTLPDDFGCQSCIDNYKQQTN